MRKIASCRTHLIKALFVFSLLFIGSNSFAGDPEGNHDNHDADHAHVEHTDDHEGEKFNAGQMIVEHITDAHEIHWIGHLSIPLPVIIYHEDRGFTWFMSSKFNHGHDAYEGYKIEHVYDDQGKPSLVPHLVAVDENGNYDAEATAKIWDFSITKNVFTLLLSMIFLILIFRSVAKSYKRREGQAPKGLQSLLEPIIIFVRDDIAKSAIGEKHYERYLPFLLTVFFFIWLNNLMGLVPGIPGFGANLTGNIAVTMVLALMTFTISTIRSNKHYWRHIFAMPGVPIPVLFILTPIEILGMFLRPFVLMIRLFANITAGHIIALSFFCLIFIFGEVHVGAGYGSAVLSITFTVFMTLLELLVAFLQAYVFALLSAMYFGAAMEEHH